MPIFGQKSLFWFFLTFDHVGDGKWLFYNDFTTAETCPYKGKKAFFGDFSTFDHVGYGKWLF